jgi:hypothetical protein
VPGSGDAYLNGVLGDDSYGPEAATGGGSAPGAEGSTVQEIQEQAEAARADARADTTWLPFDDLIAGARQAAATVGATAGSGGAGYKFDRETIEAKIREFEDLRDEIKTKREELMNAAQMATPPSFDPPALAQVRATHASLEAAATHNAEMVAYAQSYVDALRKANGTYVAQEEDSSGVFGGSGSGSSGTGALFQ